jgi:NDP-sugar pyrophosphorylase family protein
MKVADNIQLIIPMSGTGKRFLDAGYDRPKPLIEVDGLPIIHHVLNLFLGVTDVVFICNNDHLRNTDMEKVLMTICPFGKIVGIDSYKKGPVHAVLQAADQISKTKEVIVSYCDYGTYWNFNKFIETARNGNYDGSIACYTGFHPHMLGSDNYAFCKEKNKELIEIKEKEPFTNNKMSEYASNGTYYFKSGEILKKYFKQLIDLDISLNGEYYVSLVYNLLIKDGLRVNIFEIENMLQWGTPYDLEIYKGWSKYFNNIKKQIKRSHCPKNTTLVLPMSGKGSRFSEVGYDVPKPLLPINQNVMVVEAVKCLPATDNKIFICLEEHIKNFSIDTILKNNFSCKIVSIQSVTQGQACTCELGIKNENINLEDPILISACDNTMYFDAEKAQKLLDDENIDVIVWSFRNNQSSKLSPNSYAWLEVDDNDNIKNVSCKKFIYNDPLKHHAIIGTMFFRKAKFFLDGLYKNYQSKITTNSEYYVDDVLNQNIKSGLVVKVFEVENYICWGTPNDYQTYTYWNEYFVKSNKY